MDAKTTDVLEELKLKYGEGRNTEDEICLKCGKILTAIPKASMRRTMHGLLQVYADDSMFCEKKLKKESNQWQNENERQNQRITRRRIGRPRLKRYA